MSLGQPEDGGIAVRASIEIQRILPGAREKEREKRGTRDRARRRKKIEKNRVEREASGARREVRGERGAVDR